jgi:hypothetical protein
MDRRPAVSAAPDSFKRQAAGPGLEPGLDGSEPPVLPLNYPAIKPEFYHEVYRGATWQRACDNSIEATRPSFSLTLQRRLV